VRTDKPRRKVPPAPPPDERLRLALEASGIRIWEWGCADNRVTWTPGPPRAGRTVAGDWLASVHPDDLPSVRAAAEACIREGVPFEAEFRVPQADGPVRWMQAIGRLIRDANGAPSRIVGTTRDVTDRRTAELERDRRLASERETARLRDAFIGVVTHELRTPITTIFGGTRILSRRWREMGPRDRDDLLADVTEEADRLYRLVEDLVVLTRVERGGLEVGDDPVNLGRVLERVVATERTRWPGVVLVVRVPPDLPSIRGEDTYLEQVLRNLLGNAAKYGGVGTTVTVTVEAQDGEVTLRVLDEGPGIEADEAEALFDLFYRSSGVAGSVAGAGIGLFVCRRLVTAMGGRIRADRRPEGGAAFEVVLPRYDDDGVA
jgi:signal transduction histidine kinase